jgi:hypothetical protein
MTARIEASLQIAGLAAQATWTDTDRLTKAFLGYKASCQAIERMAIWCNGHKLDYDEQFAPEVGFCYASLRSWSMRDRKRYIHTLYEAARQYLPNVAGTYISLYDFADGLPHPVIQEINIPVIDLLVMQCFDKWLRDMGSLLLGMYFTHRSLVFTTCSARDVLDNKLYLQDDALTTTTLAGDTTTFTHAFSQIGDPCQSHIKASCQAIERMTIWCNGKKLDYDNNFIPEEGFCYASLRSWSMRDRKRYIHTLYESVRQYLPNIAGTYISLYDFADGLAHPVIIEINIPVIALLALQCFDYWLRDMGSLMLEMHFATKSLVFCDMFC